MDDRRFDTWTRALAGTGSRRGALRVLAGGTAAGLLATMRGQLNASAHHGTLGPGDPCRDSRQCVAADAPLVCADNGFAYDGPLNCCTFEGSRCGSDEACCGLAACVGGVCRSAPAYSGPGDPCQNSAQCIAADTALYCDYVASTDDYRCCALDGSRCGSDSGCCGSLSCVGGFCE